MNTRRPVFSWMVPLAAAWLVAACAQTRQVGETLDGEDLRLMESTTQMVLESNKIGVGANWDNPANGHRGTVTALRTVDRESDEPCRDYQVTVTVGNSTDSADDHACRQSNGSWVSTSFAGLAGGEWPYERQRYYRDRYYAGEPYYRPYYGRRHYYPYYGVYPRLHFGFGHFRRHRFGLHFGHGYFHHY